MTTNQKDLLTIGLSGLSLALILTQTNLVDSIVYLVLAGVLPHTNLTIPYWVMMIACLSLLGTILVWLVIAAIEHRRYISMLRSTPRRRYASL